MLFGFGKNGPDAHYGAIVDVGSGSVGVAIVVSVPETPMPEVVWSYRERMLVRDNQSVEINKKSLKTCILNAILELGNTGIRKLKSYDPSAKLNELNVAFCAPWSYTVTKTINLEDENPFSLTPKLLKELVAKAEMEATKVIKDEFVTAGLKLAVLNNATVDITANGYRVHQPHQTEIRKVTLSQLVSMVDTDLLEAVEEIREKVMPNCQLVANSFMFTYYQALAELYPDTAEICLVDITAEATELGIVRDNVLVHTTYTQDGMYSLAREISELCKVPREEALGVMRENGTDINLALGEGKQAELTTIFTAFEAKLAELFKRTGDALSIPKTIFMHCDAQTEVFFSARLNQAATKATGSNHSIHPITSKFFAALGQEDSAISLSAYVFHKKIAGSSYLDE